MQLILTGSAKNKVCVPVHGGGIFYTEREHMQKERALMRQLTVAWPGGGVRRECWGKEG